MKLYIKRSFLYFIIGSLTIIFMSCESNEDLDKIHVTPQEQPIISSVVPASAEVGQQVTVTGSHFSSMAGDNILEFNGVKAQLVSVSKTELVGVVPNNATTGQVRVTVINFSTTGPTFIVESPTPVITAFSPDKGSEGTTITILGENFGEDIASLQVEFNGVLAEVESVTSTQINVKVPTDATSGPITVTVNGKSDSGQQDFTVTQTSTLTIPISTSEDDVEESEDTGTMELTSSDLELGEYDTTGTPDLGVQNIGLRFNGVSIPQGATIVSAAIQFTCDNVGANPVELTIYGENIGDAMPYGPDTGNLSARALTTAAVVWSIPEWVNVGDKLEAQKTVDISAVIQEIVNRGDWVSGNSLNIIMKHSGVSIGVTDSDGGREAETFDGDAAPELILTFQ